MTPENSHRGGGSETERKEPTVGVLSRQLKKPELNLTWDFWKAAQSAHSMPSEGQGTWGIYPAAPVSHGLRTASAHDTPGPASKQAEWLQNILCRWTLGGRRKFRLVCPEGLTHGCKRAAKASATGQK